MRGILGIYGMTGMSKVLGRFRIPAMRGMIVFPEIRRNPVTPGIPAMPKMTGMPGMLGSQG